MSGPRVTDRFIKLGPGRRVHIAVAGSGPDVLFFPGNSCSADDLGPVAERIAERFRLIAVDPPGREPTAWPDEPFSFIEDLPEVVERVTTAVGVGPHVVIGHSMGGMLALHHSRRHRHADRRALGLVLMEGFVSMAVHARAVSPDGFRPVRMADGVRAAFEARRAANRAWEGAHPVFHHSFLASQQAHDARPWVAELCLPMQVFIGDLGQPMPQPPQARLSARLGFQHAAGNNAERLDSWRRHLGLDGVKDLEVHVVPDAGHWMMLDDPTAVGDSIMGFLKRVFGSQDKRL